LIEQGYAVIAPDYEEQRVWRGLLEAIDYGGLEIEDVMPRARGC